MTVVIRETIKMTDFIYIYEPIRVKDKATATLSLINPAYHIMTISFISIFISFLNIEKIFGRTTEIHLTTPIPIMITTDIPKYMKNSYREKSIRQAKPI